MSLQMYVTTNVCHYKCMSLYLLIKLTKLIITNENTQLLTFLTLNISQLMMQHCSPKPENHYLDVTCFN